MAIKTVAVSDISQAEVPDDQHVRVVVKHPDFPTTLELDVTAEEADKFRNTALRMVTVTIYAPDVPPREAMIETKTLDKLFTGVDFNKVLEGARKAELSPAGAPRRGRPARAAAAPKSGDKPDYTAPDRYGQLHRGRITDEESRLVRENPDQASKNREVQGHPPIDWNDAKEKARYGL